MYAHLAERTCIQLGQCGGKIKLGYLYIEKKLTEFFHRGRIYIEKNPLANPPLCVILRKLMDTADWQITRPFLCVRVPPFQRLGPGRTAGWALDVRGRPDGPWIFL
jgi:hypothetical protein